MLDANYTSRVEWPLARLDPFPGGWLIVELSSGLTSELSTHARLCLGLKVITAVTEGIGLEKGWIRLERIQEERIKPLWN